MSVGGSGGVVGGGSGNNSLIIDITGEAKTFHGVPFHTIKKATFTDKLGAAKSLFKMVVNGVLVDFRKTAQNGAVLFGQNYGLWDFVAPDGRFPFGGYGAMTVGQTLLDMEHILTEAPVPAWDRFIQWLNENLQNYDLDLSQISSFYICPILLEEENQEEVLSRAVRGGEFTLEELTDCVAFIQSIEQAVAPVADRPLSEYMTGEASFGFTILACTINQNTGEEQISIPLSFQFRQ